MKAEKLCIFMMVVTLPIIALPKRFSIIGLGNNLSFYFLLLLIVLFITGNLLNKNINRNINVSSNFVRYLLLYCIWIFITTIYGIYNYPYYSSVDLSGSHMLTKISSTLSIDINDSFNKAVFLLFKSFSEGFKVLIFPWCSAYVIYNILSKDKDNAYFFIRKCFVALAICLGIYAIPEILLFKLHVNEAAKILEITNPYFYDVKSYLGWYPPAIWHDEQLRSYCIEPGALGGISGVIIPFLWSTIIKNMKLHNIMLYIYYLILPIMSKSRTAIVILILIYIQSIFYIESIKYFKKILLVILFSGFVGVFLGIQSWDNILFMKVNSYVNNNDNNISTVNSYIDNNISTILDRDARSNGSRLINIKSHLNVILQHPITGTGIFLKDMYVKDNLANGAMDNGEIKTITNGIASQGLYRYSYGNVNDYIVIATDIGIIGLLFHLFPIMYLGYIFIKKSAINNEQTVTVFIALISILASMMAGPASLALYILIPLGYILVLKE